MGFANFTKKEPLCHSGDFLFSALTEETFHKKRIILYTYDPNWDVNAEKVIG